MARKPNKALETQCITLSAKGLSGRQVAQTLNISRATVSRALARTAADSMAAEQALRDYHLEVRNVLPDAKRAGILAAVASNTEEPMAQLKAIQHVDHLLRLMPTSRPRDEQDGSPAPVSLFSLPDGATVGLVIKPGTKGTS